eukprot:599267-Amphidinium_carterae.1
MPTCTSPSTGEGGQYQPYHWEVRQKLLEPKCHAREAAQQQMGTMIHQVCALDVLLVELVLFLGPFAQGNL